jgi:hypothetical protein
LVAAHSNDLGVATTAIELVGLIVVEIAALIFAPESAPLIVPILIASIIALFAFGKTAFDAYWVSDRYGEVLCALFCNIGDDGQFTDAGFAAFLAKYSTDLPASVAKDMLYRDMIACGVKGLNNMCAYGTSASADCSDCDCGDCDNLLDWSIFDDSRGSFGTITNKKKKELHLTASNAVDGTYYVVLTTGNADICCKIVDAYQPAGHAAAPSTAAYHACGETPGFAGAHAGHPESGAGTCVNFVYYNSVTAFDLVLVFENC